MHARIFVSIVTIIFIVTAGSALEPATFPRHPSLSPDGSQIAFIYTGDIWSVNSQGGQALRLTTHPSYERNPVWSPDGKWIAFSAARDGDDDLFVIPADGGEARRLTWLDQREDVCCWTPDSRALIISVRRQESYPDYAHLFKIPLDGGEPTLLTDAYGADARLSDDGKELLVSRYDPQWWRKGYLSSGASQVWRLDLARQKWELVSPQPSPSELNGEAFLRPTERWPIWGADHSLYLVSEKSGTANLWKRSQDGKWSQITNYTGDGVRFPSISHETGLLAFEQGLDIWTLKPGGTPAKINISVVLDPSDSTPQDMNFSDRADRLVLNPDGKELFVGVRGEVAAGRIVGDDDKAARGRANNLSQDNPARESDFTVSVGGDSLVVVSDRSGNKDLYLVTSDDPDTKELARSLHVKWEPITQTPDEESNPRFSPDGKSLAFQRGAGDLIIRNLSDGKERSLLTGWSLMTYVWSPDSKWIAFAREDDDYNSDVFIIPVAGGSEVNISKHPDEDELPVWSADGRKLGFRSRRRDNNWDIYFVWLRQSDEQKTAADFAEDVRNKDAKKEKKGEKEKKGDAKKKDKGAESADSTTRVEVLIDTTDMFKRLHAVTNLAGEESNLAISPDGEQFVFTSNHEGDRDIYKIKWNGEGLRRLTTGGSNPKLVEFDSAGKRIRYLDGGGRVKSVDADGGSSKDHPFDLRLSVDRRAERRQKFMEIWRGINHQFYDDNFHGKDWDTLRDKYRPWAEAASCENDFGDVVNMMFGELNSSHMGYRPPMGGMKLTGRLGVDLTKPALGPGMIVSRIIKDGPADRLVSKLEVGDRILSVAGDSIGGSIPLDKILDDQVGQRTELLIERKGEQKRVVIRPTSSNDLDNLVYEEWVKSRRQIVDSLSGGKLGYLHIRGMGDESLARFESELYSVGAGKDGLVLDVRFNGGGWTTDWLLAMLQVKRHAVTYPRDGGPGYPQSRLPLYSWVKPVIAICNEHSFSNAEIFSHSIKTLQRGSLVGVPTPGGVISTGGDDLLDGSTYRIPLRGWFVGSDLSKNPAKNMEGHGAIPDLIVPLDPGQTSAQDDLQLKAAVQVLLNTSGNK